MKTPVATTVRISMFADYALWFFVLVLAIALCGQVFVWLSLHGDPSQDFAFVLIGIAASAGGLFVAVLQLALVRLRIAQAEEKRNDALVLIDAIEKLTTELKRRPDVQHTVSLSLFGPS